MIEYNFSDGFDPNSTKESAYGYRIDYCDTPWTVKSDGISVDRFLFTGESEEPDFINRSNLTFVDTITTNIVGFYTGEGVMLGYHDVDNIALHYSGYFYANHPSDAQAYIFNTYGFGYLKLIINDKYILGSPSAYLTLNDKTSISGDIILNAETWYKIDIYYYNIFKESGFTLLWTNATNEFKHFIPLSAGVLSTTGSFKSTTKIEDIIEVSKQASSGDLTSLTFKIPLSKKDSEERGYYYDKATNSYRHTIDEITLKKNRLVEFSVINRKIPKTFSYSGEIAETNRNQTDKFNIVRDGNLEAKTLQYITAVWGSMLARYSPILGTNIQNYTASPFTWPTVSETINDSYTGKYVYVGGIDLPEAVGKTEEIRFESSSYSQKYYLMDMVLFTMCTGTVYVKGYPSNTIYDTQELDDSNTWWQHYTADFQITNSSDTRVYYYINFPLDKAVVFNSITVYAEDRIKKFMGHIVSFRTVRDKKSKEYIEVICHGFEKLFKDQLNLNYPNLYDYWNVGYAGKGISDITPDGINCPSTYDGWGLPEVCKSIFIRAGVDPTLFLTKEYHYNLSNVLVEGNYLIEETSPAGVILDTNLGYGNSQLVNLSIDQVPDEEYIHKSNFGDTLFDYLNSITDVYGWMWGFDYYYGAPYLKSRNNPATVYTMRSVLEDNPYGMSYSLSGGSTEYDLHSIGGKYIITNTTDDYFTFTFKGRKANLIVVTNTVDGAIGKINEFSIDDTTITISSEYQDFVDNVETGSILIICTRNGQVSLTVTNKVGNIITLPITSSMGISNGDEVKFATFKIELEAGTTWTGADIIETKYGSCYFDNGQDRLLKNFNISELGIVAEDKRYYYDGYDPYTNSNPTILTATSNLAYDDYTLKITRIDNTGAPSDNTLRVDGLFVYDHISDLVVDTFYTGDSIVSGTVVSLEVMDSNEDLRNDTIVIGRRLGIEVAGSEEDIINPNNPTFRHIISRSTDVASIYDSNVLNYVGYPKQTIQIAPEISSQARADYWSIAFINRYRFPGNYPKFASLGNPLMEVGDCITIYDEHRNTLNTYDKFWVTAINESYTSSSYISNFDTTTYEAWESYTPKLNINTEDFGDTIINDLRIYNRGTFRVPYNPYSSETSGTVVKIFYDLVIDCWLKIDIVPVENPSLVVATLLNPTGNVGPQGWQRQNVGKNYVVTWDGVDYFGEWNKYCTENTDQGIGAGFYCAEKNDFGKFYLKFTVITRSSDVTLLKYSTDLDLISEENNPDGYIYTKRSGLTTLALTITPRTYISNGGRNIDDLTSEKYFNKACFSDSIKYNPSENGTTYDATIKIHVEDVSNDYANKCRKYFPDDNSEDTIYWPYPLLEAGSQWNGQKFIDVGVTGGDHQEFTDEEYTDLILMPNENRSNRSVQLQIKAVHQTVAIVVKAGYPKVINLPPREGVYYNNSNFVNYTGENGLDVYLNFPAYELSYDYVKVLNSDDVNDVVRSYQIDPDIKKYSICLGVYSFIEVEAYDKSGRRCRVVTTPAGRNIKAIFKTGPYREFDITNKLVNSYGVYGKTIFWIDDKLPYPLPPTFKDIYENTSGYESLFANIVNPNDNTPHWRIETSTGGNVMRNVVFGPRAQVQLILVYPKIDKYGNTWGY
jgi:hypothetical protein